MPWMILPAVALRFCAFSLGRTRIVERAKYRSILFSKLHSRTAFNAQKVGNGDTVKYLARGLCSGRALPAEMLGKLALWMA